MRTGHRLRHHARQRSSSTGSKATPGIFPPYARFPLLRNSLHLESEVLQFALAFDLKDYGITRSEIADHGLEL
jgi:hypothetical protein